MSKKRRALLLEAVEGPAGFDGLRALVQSCLDGGVAEEVLLEDLDGIRALVDEPTGDLVLDVMDLLVGWCSPTSG